jgi:hypothetical protein
MFNFNSVVDQVAQASKQPLTYVEDKAIRTSIETLVDTYADLPRPCMTQVLSCPSTVVESTKSVDFTKAFEKATKNFKVAA